MRTIRIACDREELHFQLHVWGYLVVSGDAEAIDLNLTETPLAHALRELSVDPGWSPAELRERVRAALRRKPFRGR